MTDDEIVAQVNWHNDSDTDSDDDIEESQPELSTVSHTVARFTGEYFNEVRVPGRH